MRKGILLAAGCLIVSACAPAKVTYVYVPVPVAPPPVASAPAAAPTPNAPPSADGSFVLTQLPDIVFASAPAHMARRTVVAHDVDKAVASPQGAYTVAGTEMYTSRGAKGGLAALYATPRGGTTGAPKKIPVTNVEYMHTSFAPDGRTLVVSAHNGLLRDPGSTPTLSLFSVPDLKSLGTFSGVDPYWIDGSTIVFRNGRTPYRVVVGGTPSAIGPEQTTYGCTHESFGPSTPCRSDVYTNVMAIAPDGRGWIVNDNSDTKHIDRMRLLRFDGTQRTTFEEGAFVTDMVFDPLAHRDRTCAVIDVANQSELRCLTLPGEKSERTILGNEKLSASWVSANTMVLFDQKGALKGTVDLAARTITHFKGIPEGARYPAPLAGGRRMILQTSGDLIDLDARTIATVLPPHLFSYKVPGDPNRFLVGDLAQTSTKAWEIADF